MYVSEIICGLSPLALSLYLTKLFFICHRNDLPESTMAPGMVPWGGRATFSGRVVQLAYSCSLGGAPFWVWSSHSSHHSPGILEYVWPGSKTCVPESHLLAKCLEANYSSPSHTQFSIFGLEITEFILNCCIN